MTKAELMSELVKLRQSQRERNSPEGDHSDLDEFVWSWLESEHPEVHALCVDIQKHARWWAYA